MGDRRRRIRLGGALLTALLLVLASCSGSSGQSKNSSAPLPPSAATGPTAGTSSAGSAPASGPSFPVIAEQKNLPVPNHTGDSMSVGVQSLTVDPNGTTMTLRLVFTPQFSSKPGQDVTLGDLAPGTYVRPSLLDRTHLKRYDVIAANDGNGFLESAADTGAANGQSFQAWFVYAAPQDQVSSFEVSVLDSWPPFSSVPVHR